MSAARAGSAAVVLLLGLGPGAAQAFPGCVAGVPFSTPDAQLIDNGDETVTDTATGLMWKQCSEGSSGVNCLTGVPPFVNFTQALALAAAANTANFAGHADWRLPNVKELLSLVETACHDPSINTTRFPNTQNSYYWTNTSYEVYPAVAWNVYFSPGAAALDYKSATKYVRLVRAGSALAAFDSTAPPPQSTSGQSPTGSGQVNASIAGGGATCGFGDAQFVAPVTAPPEGVTFPHGMFGFSLYGCTPGATVTFTMTYPEPLGPGTRFWKYGPTGGDPAPHWYLLPATISGNQAQFAIQDGGLGDDDLAANGRISDPGGPEERLFANGFE